MEEIKLSPLNDKPFEYHCNLGTIFRCSRCDFRGKVYVATPPGMNHAELASDTAEMIGYHATNIWNRLNGFRGYDCIEFVVGEVGIFDL